MNDHDDPLARRLRTDAERWRAQHPAPDLAQRVRARLRAHATPPARSPWAAVGVAAAVLFASALLFLGRGNGLAPAAPVAEVAPLPALDALVAASTEFALAVVDDVPVMSEYEALVADASAVMDGLLASFAAPIEGLVEAQ